MTKRAERSRLNEAPLIFVLAQVRIAAVLRMQSHIPEIQDQLRGKGFVRFKEVQGQQVVFGPAPKVTPIHQWVFANRDRSSAVVLAPDFVVLETNQYSKFEQFAEDLLAVLNVVGEVARVDLAERLGLRYVDLIRPARTGDTYRDYLRSSLHGLDTSALSKGEVFHRLETRAETDVGGTLVVKVAHSKNGGYLPPDVDGNHLAFDDVPDKGEHVVVLDIDHFSEEPRDFKPTKLVDGMWELHGLVRKAFEQAVTPHAIEQWKPVGKWNVGNS